MSPKSVVTSVERKENVHKWWKPQVAYYCDHHAIWHVLSWNHEKSPHHENVGGVHIPCSNPSLSIHPLVLGQHNIQYSLLIPLAMDHPNHIKQYGYQECNIGCDMV